MPSSPEASSRVAREAAEASLALWAQILDDFERQLTVVDLLGVGTDDAGLLTAASGSWVPPTDMGPLPEEERARALQVLSAQRDAMTRLHDLRVQLTQHIEVTNAATVTRLDAAVYLDRIA